MQSTSVPIDDIADTARLMAIYRALESERPDALFQDPYARLLAGERGEEIVRMVPRSTSSSWTSIVRTVVFDELILQTVRDGVDTVLVLAAGLDTRPYRLPLPHSIRWVEVDRPNIVSYKEEKLAHAQPVCALERVKLDIADRDARNILFSRINQEAKQVLVVTEGFLVYMRPEQVTLLSADLHSQLKFRNWLISLSSPSLLKMRQKIWRNHITSADVKMQFAPGEGGKFFQRSGWNVVISRSTLAEARRLKRTMPFNWLMHLRSFLSTKQRESASGKQSGYILLERM